MDLYKLLEDLEEHGEELFKSELPDRHSFCCERAFELTKDTELDINLIHSDDENLDEDSFYIDVTEDVEGPIIEIYCPEHK